jgi:uridine monophosphate synthetase
VKGFFPILAERVRKSRSLLCVGIDPPLDSVTHGGLEDFGRRIVEETGEAACLYKPNIAFYEARGPDGLRALLRTVELIHSLGFPVLLDAKRGDISSTAAAYAKAAFEVVGADAITVNPLSGGDGVEEFTSFADRGVFILCHTSNPGSQDIQDLEVEGEPVYLRIARLAAVWNARGNVGLVIGATYPEVLARVRRLLPEMWFLLPGIGKQGGDLAASLEAGLNSHADGLIINVSRGISAAPDPRKAAMEYRDRINEARGKIAAERRLAAGANAAGTRPPEAPDGLLHSIALGLFDLGAVRFGEFTLKSGLTSPIYIDLRILVSSPRLMAVVARGMAGLLSRLTFDRIAAIPYGGLPIGEVVSLETGKPLVYARREVKEYGTRKAIEGLFTTGETAVVLDDLITTGGSKIEAIDPLTRAGLSVRDVVVLIDREQGGAAELAARGYRLHSLITLSVLLDALVSAGRITGEMRAAARTALGITRPAAG